MGSQRRAAAQNTAAATVNVAFGRGSTARAPTPPRASIPLWPVCAHVYTCKSMLQGSGHCRAATLMYMGRACGTHRAHPHTGEHATAPSTLFGVRRCCEEGVTKLWAIRQQSIMAVINRRLFQGHNQHPHANRCAHSTYSLRRPSPNTVRGACCRKLLQLPFATFKRQQLHGSPSLHCCQLRQQP